MADIPEWAKKRARELLLEADPRQEWERRGELGPWIINAFSAYIAAHEEEPVDPDLLEARKFREAEVGERGSASFLRFLNGGSYDLDSDVQKYVRAIKRGRELQKAQGNG